MKNIKKMSLVFAGVVLGIMLMYGIRLVKAASSIVAINACVNKSDGGIRIIIDGKGCKGNEFALNWWDATTSEKNSSIGGFKSKDFSGAVLNGFRYAYVDFTDFDFTEADLNGSMFIDSVFTNVKFTGAKVSADFTRSNFTGADLTGIIGDGGIFVNTIMRGANLTNASLITSNFAESDFTGTNLTGVNFEEANLYHAIFTDVIGLSTIRWNGTTVCPDGTHGWDHNGTCLNNLSF